jgi:hypothetical protein
MGDGMSNKQASKQTREVGTEAPRRNVAIAGNSGEGLTLARIQRPTKRGFRRAMAGTITLTAFAASCIWSAVAPFAICRQGIIKAGDLYEPGRDWHPPDALGPIGSGPPPGSGPLDW